MMYIIDLIFDKIVSFHYSNYIFYCKNEENKITVLKRDPCTMSSKFTSSKELLQTPREMLHDGKV